MSWMRWGWGVSAAVVLATAAVGDARADDAGDKALAAVDAAMSRASTYYFEYDVTNQEAGKPEATLALVVRVKGEKKLVEFRAPADMKGTKLLVLGPTQAYVYLPAFGKVRRVSSSTSGQGFLGLSFGLDDLATHFGDRYTAAVASESATELVLTATPKPGQSTPYAKIVMTVAKGKMLPTKLAYYDAKGVNVKTEERTGYTCEGNVCTPDEQKMTDNVKRSSTRLVRKAWKVNEAMSDDVFSKRNLEE